MAQYARGLPIDQNNNPYPGIPAQTSYQSQGGVPIASSVITLSDKTSVVDITVIGGQSGNAAVIGKWGSASVTGTNFDFVVNSGQSRTFVVPIQPTGTPTGSIAGTNVANNLFPTVSLKTATAQSASVFTAEY